MRLRTRLLLGYSYLLALLVISAAGAAVSFHRLGTDIGRVLTENFDSVRSSMAMLEALERQDSAVLGALLGDDASRHQVETSEASFTSALDAARANITLDVEHAIIRDITRRYQAYRAARDRLILSAHERPLRAYEEETFPLFEEVKGLVYTLLEANHQAMVEADRRAQREATQRALTLGMLVMVALLSLALVSRSLNRDVLARISELTSVAQSIGRGDLNRRAPTGWSDELGTVARQLNTLLDQLQTAGATAEGSLVLLRQLLRALLAASDEPAALLTLDGRVIAATMDSEAASAAAAEAARSGPQAGEDRIVELEGWTIRFRLLRSDPSRRAGWLATLTRSRA